jgi:hypothetical protein
LCVNPVFACEVEALRWATAAALAVAPTQSTGRSSRAQTDGDKRKGARRDDGTVTEP